MKNKCLIKFECDAAKEKDCSFFQPFKNSKESILVNAEEVSVSKIAYKDSSQLQRSALL